MLTTIKIVNDLFFLDDFVAKASKNYKKKYYKFAQEAL